MFFSSIKGINRLISKGMSNITIEKNWRSKNFDFLKFKKFVFRSAFGELKLAQISLNFKTSCCKSEVWEQNFVWLFHYFNFKRNYDVLKSKGPCILVNKNINFNKNEAESKMENPKHSFRDLNLVLQLI